MIVKKLYLFLILFKLSSAKINIDIITGDSIENVTVNYSGLDMKVVTSHEIDLFRLSKRNLMSAVENHYGRRPTNVYLKSPTPWGDLYQEYHWEQVTRILSVKSARVKSITRDPLIVLSHDFENVSNRTIKVNTAISQSVENTFTTSWSKSKEISVSQEIEYDVNFLFAKLTGTTTFSYTTNWGESEEKSESVTIGSTSAVETELQPGQAVTAVLSASKGYVEIEVIYMAALRGNVAVNFKKSLKGHHFWGPPVENVMKSGGLSNEITTVENIKLGYFIDASLKVYDKETGMPL